MKERQSVLIIEDSISLCYTYKWWNAARLGDNAILDIQTAFTFSIIAMDSSNA